MLKNIGYQITAMILILFVTIIQVAEGGRLRCNPEQLAERGKPFVITCNTTDPAIDVYWFKGEDTSDFPILAYENGNQRGTEYKTGEYELTANFNLKIIHIQVKHERKYTVRVYYQEHDYETVTTSVRVYDLPSPPCPYVDACGLSCNGCVINVNTSGHLVCYVNGSRPGFDLDWSVDKPVGISYAEQGQVKRNKDTRHTERTISYHIDRCGTNATFHCMANASVSWAVNILDTYTIQVQVRSDDCEAPVSTDTSSNGKNKLIVIGIAIGTAVLGCLLGFRFLLRKGRTTIKEKKNILITNLLTVYEKFCFVKPLPWEEPIPINSLYTPPNCTVTDAKGNINRIISSDLLEKQFISKNSRILLIAELGHGKTSFTKYFVDKWITSQQNDNNQTTMNAFILIHVHLKDVEGSDLLSDIIKKTLPAGHGLTSKDIDEILHSYDCIVLFDGLDEMSMSARKVVGGECSVTVIDETEKLTTFASKLTIDNILRNTFNSSRYQKLKLWVTSRDIDYMNTVFALPYSKVAFSFNKENVKQYITMTCKYYLELCGKVSELKSIENYVTKLIEKNEIVEIFYETPLLLMMIVHIITNKLVTKKKKYEKVNLDKLTSVMKLVLLCLGSRYVDKMNKRPNATKNIKTILTKLGQLALENQCNTTSDYWTQKLGKELTQTALDIGLLKYSGKVELEGSLGKDLLQSSFSGIVFYHDYFKQFLAAQYILDSNKEWERLNQYIDKSDDEGTIRLLQFMSGLDHPEVHRLFKVLLTKQDMWNNIIDCMYEINDPEQKKLLLEDFKRKQSTRTTIPIINVRYLEKQYHKIALADFCKACGEHDIKLRLGFQENCAITFVKEETLPPLMSLVFTDMSFNQHQYVSVITTLTTRKCTDALWFVRCNLPKTFSQTNKKNLDKALKATGMAIKCSEKMPGVHSISSTLTGTKQMTSYL